jgi:hypothetical protein
MFSAPVGYTGELRHTPLSLRQTRRTMLDLLGRYPEAVLFSPYNAVAHTHHLGLHALYGCSYPRMQSLHRHRPGPLVPAVPHRPDLGPGSRLLRARTPTASIAATTPPAARW